ncbi:MAG: hypothetical protein F6J93_39650 [Oscillatoria sp. SIO1A7]|nr:hypothetical protein [Oscillatoria sp. SIO1A7]
MEKIFQVKKFLIPIVIVLLVFVGTAIALPHPPKPGTVIDEAMQAGRTPESLPSSEDDYLRDMDYGITKDPEKVRAILAQYVPDITEEEAVNAVVRGRNNWTIWTGGNDTLWDELSRKSFGNLDFLKTLSSHEKLPNKRENRWEYLGLVNEPCFKKASGPREDRYGLWLDERIESPECPPDPFEDEDKYPGVEVGARGKNGLPVGSYYGYASGVVGLRLFPNPAFDAKAQKKWDPVRYYNDPSYYNDKKLVKPYRVGMSCAFCHVGPNPTNPPKDFNEPKWENLNSNPGTQYFWFDRIFSYNPDKNDFIYQLLHTSRPGALDTSLVSSDQINNPRTMNAFYQLGPRLELAQKWGKEKLEDGELDNKQFNDYAQPDGPLPANGPLNDLYYKPNVLTPRVLKDGADSVGGLGALNRVFVNIGLFSEEWLLHFIPLIGGPKITPFPIATAKKNSVYWNATTMQTPDLALFFLAATPPDYLKDAPGAQKYLTKDKKVLKRGKEVFAETCARCHSSKLPEKAFLDFFPDKGCVNSNYLTCWDDYWQWTKTDEFKEAMKEIVLKPDFLDNNYMSNDLRVPVTLLETNASSPLATNAIANDIWNDFSSSSYKNLPSVGTITVHNPFTLEPREYEMPKGGRGYTRPPSLVSLWSTAPFLLNNSLGKFEEAGTVEARMTSFDDSIAQLLWPENRKGNVEFLTASGKMAPGKIDLTTETSYLKLPGGFLPGFLQLGCLQKFFPNIFGDGGVKLGPIPEGTPINLLSNINLKETGKLIKLLPKALWDLIRLPKNPTDEQARKVFSNLADPLLEVSKSPDFVVNRGHYFGTDYLPASEGETPLSDEDKQALIEFLKYL